MIKIEKMIKGVTVFCEKGADIFLIQNIEGADSFQFLFIWYLESVCKDSIIIVKIHVDKWRVYLCR